MIHTIGLSPRGLPAQIVVARVRSIDPKKLAQAAGTKPVYLDVALPVADLVPRATFDFALPLIKEQLRNFGIEAELSMAEAPPPARPRSDLFPGVAIGVGASGLLGLFGFVLFKVLKVFK